MKKLVLCFGLCLLVKSLSFACDCSGTSNFCESVTQAKIYSPATLLVAKVTVENTDKEKADLRILQVYWGSESAEIIKCFKEDPIMCGTIDVSKVGETFIFVFYRIEVKYQFSSPSASIGDYRLPVCQFGKLLVANGKISGNITESKEQVINENDFICAGLNTNPVFKNVVLAPNPTTNQVSVKGLENETVATIYDIHGRILKQIKLQSAQNSISLIELASGIYIVRLQQNASVLVTKIIKL